MTLQLGLILATVLLALLLGRYWRHRQGRVQAARASGLPDLVLGRVDRTAAVTLLQLNSPVCARCPQARAVLGELVGDTTSVAHAQLDLAEHPDLAGELKVRSTPTTLVISRNGEELFRVSGVPHRGALLAALQPHL